MPTNQSTPTLTSAISDMLDARLDDVHVAMPARVESYDASQQRVSAKPIIKRSYLDESGNRQVDSLPVIEDIPVAFPGAGAYSITFPLSKGDTVLLVFSELNLGKWLEEGAADVDPDDDRRHSMTDAIAIPGIRSFKNPTDQVDSGAVVISGAEVKLGSKDASDPVALKSDLTALKAWLDTHIHQGVTVGSGVTGAGVSPGPTFGPSPTPTAASKVKAE